MLVFVAAVARCYRGYDYTKHWLADTNQLDWRQHIDHQVKRQLSFAD